MAAMLPATAASKPPGNFLCGFHGSCVCSYILVRVRMLLLLLAGSMMLLLYAAAATGLLASAMERRRGGCVHGGDGEHAVQPCREERAPDSKYKLRFKLLQVCSRSVFTFLD